MIGPPASPAVREKNVGHVLVNTTTDKPWSQYFCCMIASTKVFVQQHPVATKRAVRALLKAADLCASRPEQVARLIAERVVAAFLRELAIRLHPGGIAGHPVWPMAGLRSRGRSAISRIVDARGWNDQENPSRRHCGAHRLALLERTQARAEGVNSTNDGRRLPMAT